MTDTTTAPAPAPDIRKGLAGVVVDVTAISKVNPESNSLLYRGYPVQELAARKSFEEVAYLLWYGELPDAAQLAGFRAAERAGRALEPNVRAAIDLLPTTSHPMDVVRTAVSVIGACPETRTLAEGATLPAGSATGPLAGPLPARLSVTSTLSPAAAVVGAMRVAVVVKSEWEELKTQS